jgi:hypothetical protein
MMEESMMMMNLGPQVLGVHVAILLMWAAGIFYIICALILWKPVRQEKNEVIGALFAFLVYQALSMIFMGLEMQTMNMLYSNIAALAIFIGSAYMLKFPFSSFSQGVRRVVFYLSIIIILSIFGWFMQNPERQMELMNFVLWYDLVINGIIVGGFMILLGIGTRERALRMKAMGGGTGVVSCCVVANGAMISGSLIAGSLFSFIAPVLIIGFITRARKIQNLSA